MNKIGGVIGGAIGAYTQSASDGSLMPEALGLGIGAAAGLHMAYDAPARPISTAKRDVNLTNMHLNTFNQSMNSFNGRYDSIMNRYSTNQNNIQTINDNVARLYNKIEGTDSKKKIIKYTKAIGRHQQNARALQATNDAMEALVVHNVNHVMGDGTMSGISDLSRIKNDFSINDTSRIDKFTTALGFKDKLSTYDIINTSEPMIKPGFDSKSPGSLTEKLTSHFSNLGLNQEDATARSKILAEALGQYDISASGNTLTARDIKTGRTQDIPLTSRGDGVNYSTIGDTKFVAKGFNPFAHLYTIGGSYSPTGRREDAMKIDAKMVAKQYAPEELLQFVKTDTMDDLAKAAGQIGKLLEYSGEEALKLGDEPSVLARTKSATNEIGLTLVPDGKGGYNMKPIGQIGSGEDTASMTNRFFSKLGRDDAIDWDPLDRISHNATTKMMTKEGSGNWAPGFFSTQEAGSSMLNLRQHRPLDDAPLRDDYFKNMSKTAQGAKDLMKHSIQGYRMDASEGVSEYLSRMYGSNVTLDDGYSLFSEKHAYSLASQEDVRIRIPNSGTAEQPSYRGSVNFEELIKNGGRIEPGAVAYGPDGNVSKLGSQYSYMDVNSTSVRPDGTLELVGKGVHMPKHGDWIKVFSTASKSGGVVLSEDIFNKAATLEQFISSGDVRMESGMPQLKEGNKFKPVSFDSLDRFLGSFGSDMVDDNLFMISRYDDTGQGDIAKILRGADSSEFIESWRGRGVEDLLDKMEMSQAMSPDTTQGAQARANIARTITAMSPEKSSADIVHTIGQHYSSVGNADKVERLKEMGVALKQFGSDRTALSNELLGMVTEAYDGNQLINSTMVTPDVGMSKVGSRNTGSSSWLEQLNLKYDGISQQAIDSMTVQNRRAQLELSMLINMDKQGSFDIADRGIDPNSLLALETEKVSAEGRRGFLAASGIDIGKEENFLSYNLSRHHNGMKSVGLSLVDTGYSGVSEISGESITKMIDKSKFQLIKADIALRDAEDTKVNVEMARSRFDAAAAKLDQQLASVSSRIIKDSIKREAKSSQILVAGSVHGYAHDFASKNNKKNAAFMSMGTAEEYMRRSGIDFDSSKHMVDQGNGIFKLRDDKKQQLMAQVSREPVQGPMSTMGMELYVDKSIVGGKGQIFVPKTEWGKSLMSTFSFLDFDADTMRVMPVTDVARGEIMKRTDKLLDFADKMHGFQDALGVKGSKTNNTTLLNFESKEKFDQYQIAAGQKGRHRKPIAPHVTKVAMDFAETLERNKSLSEERKTAARMLAHNLTENMLKTKHKDTQTFLDNPNGAVEKLTSAQSSWKQRGFSSSDSDFSRVLNNVIDETLGAKMEEAAPEVRATYKQAVADLSESYMSHGGNVLRESINPMDMSDNAFKGAKERASAAKDIALHGGASGSYIDGVDDGIAGNMARAKNVMYNDVKTSVVNTVKKNKVLLGGTAIGLGALAAVTGSREPGAASLPSPEARPLEPLNDRKAYIHKYKEDDGYDVRADIKTGQSNLNPRSMHRTLFGDSINNANINVTDKSGMF